MYLAHNLIMSIAEGHAADAHIPRSAGWAQSSLPILHHQLLSPEMISTDTPEFWTLVPTFSRSTLKDLNLSAI